MKKTMIALTIVNLLSVVALIVSMYLFIKLFT